MEKKYKDLLCKFDKENLAILDIAKILDSFSTILNRLIRNDSIFKIKEQLQETNIVANDYLIIKEDLSIINNISENVFLIGKGPLSINSHNLEIISGDLKDISIGNTDGQQFNITINDFNLIDSTTFKSSKEITYNLNFKSEELFNSFCKRNGDTNNSKQNINLLINDNSIYTLQVKDDINVGVLDGFNIERIDIYKYSIDCIRRSSMLYEAHVYNLTNFLPQFSNFPSFSKVTFHYTPEEFIEHDWDKKLDLNDCFVVFVFEDTRREWVIPYKTINCKRIGSYAMYDSRYVDTTLTLLNVESIGKHGLSTNIEHLYVSENLNRIDHCGVDGVKNIHFKSLEQFYNIYNNLNWSRNNYWNGRKMNLFVNDEPITEITLTTSNLSMHDCEFNINKLTLIPESNDYIYLDASSLDLPDLHTLIIKSMKAPSLYYLNGISDNSKVFGNGELGKNNRGQGINKLIVPTGAIGYEDQTKGWHKYLLGVESYDWTIEYSDELAAELNGEATT